MITTTTAFNTRLQEDSRTFRARFLNNGSVLDAGIKNITINKGACGETFSVGSVYSSYIEVTLDECDEALENKELQLQIGLLLDDGSVEYLTMGYYTVTTVERTAYRTTFTAVGRISAKLNCLPEDLPESRTLANLAAAITETTGISITCNGVTLAGTIEEDLTGLTCKEILEVITAVLGGFATENGSGGIIISRFSTANTISCNGERTTTEAQFADYDYSLTGIKVVKTEEWEDEDGSVHPEVSFSQGTPRQNLSLKYMTQSLFTAFAENTVGFTYRPGTVPLALGDPRLEPWDTIRFTDIKGNVYNVPCMSIVHYFDGGLSTTITAPGESKSESKTQSKGPLVQQLERVAMQLFTAEQAIVKRLTADEADIRYATIENLDATNANIENLTGSFANFKTGEFESLKSSVVTADNLEVKVAILGYATVDRLEATEGKIDDLTAVAITTDNISAKVGEFGYLTASDFEGDNARFSYLKTTELETEVAKLGYATIKSLEATDARFDSLSSKYATIDLVNVENGSITAAMIGTGVVGTVQIADGSVTDAKIVGLTANKITAGTLDAGTIDVINLNAANITVGTINGQQIASGAIDASKLTDDLNSTISSASENAERAQETADGKNTVFYQTSAPSASGRKNNDIWFNTGDGNRMYYWNGSAWTEGKFGTNAIASASITNALIADAAIQSAKIANLDAGKITTGTLSADRIAASGITAAKIASGAVTTDKIAAGAVTADSIASGAVTSDKIVAGAVTAEKIASKTITANEIASGAVTTDKLGVNAVTAGKIASKAITADKIDVEDLFAEDITATGNFNLGSGGALAYDAEADTVSIRASLITMSGKDVATSEEVADVQKDVDELQNITLHTTLSVDGGETLVEYDLHNCLEAGNISTGNDVDSSAHVRTGDYIRVISGKSYTWTATFADKESSVTPVTWLYTQSTDSDDNITFTYLSSQNTATITIPDSETGVYVRASLEADSADDVSLKLSFGNMDTYLEDDNVEIYSGISTVFGEYPPYRPEQYNWQLTDETTRKTMSGLLNVLNDDLTQVMESLGMRLDNVNNNLNGRLDATDGKLENVSNGVNSLIGDNGYIAIYPEEPCIDLGRKPGNTKVRITDSRVSLKSGNIEGAFVGIEENRGVLGSGSAYITEYFPKVQNTDGTWTGGLAWVARANGHLSLKAVT